MDRFEIEQDIVFLDAEKERLKKPLGKIFKGEPPDTTREVVKYIKERNPRKLIVVGDFSSKELSRSGLDVDVYVVDRKVERVSVDEFYAEGARVLRTKNPAGTISAEASRAIKDAIKSNFKVMIVVDGEEDLLTLAAILYAPINSFVVYGQPKEGAVVVEVTDEKKEEVRRILKRIIDRLNC